MSIAGRTSLNHPRYGRSIDDGTDDRATMWEDFNPLHERFRFTVDVAASDENHKLPRYWTRKDNGLEQDWTGERVWCNPPFSRLEPWIRKAWHGGAELVALLMPANRTERTWWHELVEPYRDRPGSPLTTEFLPGRMRFLAPGMTDAGSTHPPFGCVLLVWADHRDVCPPPEETLL